MHAINYLIHLVVMENALPVGKRLTKSHTISDVTVVN